MARLNQQYTPKEAKVKIAKFCAYQERCHQEVRDKLFLFGLLPNDVEEIIFELIQEDFINEERFTKAFVRGKFNYKKWGRIKITQELKRRKISDYCIKKGLAEISDIKYHSVLEEILTKKIAKQSDIKDYQKSYKAVQFAMSKGFEAELAWTIIKSSKN
ncbi:MAG: regulatory protein RecX [Bacteroidia bacterium]|nr:regulatory protein RecX [Bacteroidia bacterium]